MGFFFLPLCGFIDRTGSRYDRKHDEKEGGDTQQMVPRPGFEPGATAARTKPLYMGCPLR